MRNMKCDKQMMRLYAVTDRAWTGEMSLYEQAEIACQNGITCLQIREKDLDGENFLKEAMEIKELCHKYNVPLIINDNVDIAIACQADGVHVGQDDMQAMDVRAKVGEDMIVGVSAHTVEEAMEAEKNGADYLGLGSVFTTSTKLDVDVMSHDTLKKICESISIPTVAIGGINHENVLKLSGSGVDGIAVVSAIFAAKDIAKATKELKELSDKMVCGNE